MNAEYGALWDAVEPYLRKSGITNEQALGQIDSFLTMLLGHDRKAAHGLFEFLQTRGNAVTLHALVLSSLDMGYAKALADIHAEKVAV